MRVLVVQSAQYGFPSSQDGQVDSSRGIYRSRLDAALDVQRQLTAQEEVLGLNRFGRTEQQHHPSQGVFDRKRPVNPS
jgi:hypothetical protein